jgi:hypothetical protein
LSGSNSAEVKVTRKTSKFPIFIDDMVSPRPKLIADRRDEKQFLEREIIKTFVKIPCVWSNDEHVRAFFPAKSKNL